MSSPLPTDPRGPRDSFVLLDCLSLVVGPVVFVMYLFSGARSGENNCYAGLSATAYNAAMSLSWVPFVLIGLACQLLFFGPRALANPHAPGVHEPDERITGVARTTLAILALHALLWGSAAWAGSVVGQVWQILPLGLALVKTLAALTLLLLTYGQALVVLGEGVAGNAGPGDESKDDEGERAAVPVSQTSNARTPAKQDPSFSRSPAFDFAWSRPAGGLQSLAGMAELKTQLADALQGLRSYSSRGPICDRNGILLSGPPGNGKTAFAQAIAGELGLPLVRLGCQDLTSKWVNESPAVVKDLFAQAAAQPCVLFFDEFDGVANSRANADMHAEDRKLVNALLYEIDNARAKHIVLIAASNYPEQLDGAMVRDGRFDFRIEIPYPDEVARAAILRALLKRFKINTFEGTVGVVAQLWECRSVAFIEATVKRVRDNGRGGRKGGVAQVEDFKLAARQACRRASAIPNSGAKLSDIALTSAVRVESDSLVYRLRHWEQIARRGGEPPSAVLLYGPPGTGKTHFVRALARELGDWHVFEVNGADVLHDPRKFRDILVLGANHRPAIIFIDEADELLRERGHGAGATATHEILKAMDGLMGRIPEIVFMAATNHPELIDRAALRAGRFGEKIFMGRLTGEDLVAFLEKDFACRSKVRFDPGLTPRRLAEKLGEAAPSDALGILRKAVNYTFTQDGGERPVCMADVDQAIESMQL